jgi:hypothetical protein
VLSSRPDEVLTGCIELAQGVMPGRRHPDGLRAGWN